MSNHIVIHIVNRVLTRPITNELVDKTAFLLNQVFNSDAFRTRVEAHNFECKNKSSLCNGEGHISGTSVFDDLMSYDEIDIDVEIRKLRNIWKRRFSKTKGETRLSGHKIKTYTWWLKNETDANELLVKYASHIGHEIFHTKYYQYKHNPKKGRSNFIENRDVTYCIDNIIEDLIRELV